MKLTNTLWAMAFLAMLSSCATSGGNSDSELPELATSESDKIDSSDSNSGLSSEVFSDLANEGDKKDITNDAASTPAAATLSDVSGGTPFYNTVGGESLGRIAYTLYGDKSFKKILKEKNPEISDGVLSADQRVFFGFDRLNPQPQFLTKDLIDRYAATLSDSIQSNGSSSGLVKATVTVGAGETLQMVSQRLYGTTRYWTEIYLLNHSKISSYDKVSAGVVLDIYEHGAIAAPRGQPNADPSSSEVTNQQQVSDSNAKEQEVAPPAVLDMPVNTQADESASSAQPNAEPVMNDPIPETPVSPMPSNQESQKVITQAPSGGGMMDSLNSTNMRRALYVSLIVLILGLAYLLTKPKKNQKFDMLDSTAQETAGRSKLKDSQNNKFVG